MIKKFDKSYIDYGDAPGDVANRSGLTGDGLSFIGEYDEGDDVTLPVKDHLGFIVIIVAAISIALIIISISQLLRIE